MPTWFAIAVAVWFVGFVAIILRCWYLQYRVFSNLAPGADPWSAYSWKYRGFRLTDDHLSPAGRALQRQCRRLRWIGAAYGSGGFLTLAALGSYVSK
jgi:hypothetical protein